MALVDATGLRLVPWLGGFALDASDLRRYNHVNQMHVVLDPAVPGLPRYVEAEYTPYRPGGPMGPMRENPYRDWPPAREGWR